MARQLTAWLAERLARGARVQAAIAALALTCFVASIAYDQWGAAVAPGVWLEAVALGGVSPSELDRELERHAASRERSRLQLVFGARSYAVLPAEVGLRVDRTATRNELVAAGRRGGMGRVGSYFSRFWRPELIAPTWQFDQAALLRFLREREREALPRPPFEGGLKVQNEHVVADPPRAGDTIDEAALEAATRLALRSSTLVVPLILRKPSLSLEQVQGAAELADRLTRGKITLRHPRASLALEVDAATLREAVQLRRTATGLDVSFDTVLLGAQLAGVMSKLERPPIDARFVIDEHDKVSILPGRRGTRLDPPSVVYALREAALSEAREGLLPIVEDAPPDLTLEQAQQLGIEELVSSFTTHHPCCQDRVKNIQRIADLIDGKVVRPGATFSVNEVVGPRTTARGFYAAPTIVFGEMKDELGGGVSQFATTMFNTVLRAGYDIVERQAHTYWFNRYPEGHEATLSFPKPDLIFRNDSAHGLLIKCDYGKTYIRVRLYGKRDGRKVKLSLSRRFDIVQPEEELIADDSLEPDKEKVKEPGRIGWSVIATRVVTLADGKTKSEQRKVTYSPRVRRIRVHSCKIPEGKPGHTGVKCPEPVDEEASASASAPTPAAPSSVP